MFDAFAPVVESKSVKKRQRKPKAFDEVEDKPRKTKKRFLDSGKGAGQDESSGSSAYKEWLTGKPLAIKRDCSSSRSANGGASVFGGEGERGAKRRAKAASKR